MHPSATFTDALLASSEAVGQLALAALVGFVFVKRRWLGQEALSGLTRLLIDVVVPCVLIAALTRGLDLERLEQAAPVFLACTVWMVAAALLCHSGLRLFPARTKDRSADRATTAMVMIQNSIYLPLPVAYAVTPRAEHDQVAVFVGVCVLPAMILQWTVGMELLRGGRGTRPAGRDKLRHLLNPPLIGIAIGAVCAFLPGLPAAAAGDPASFAPLRTLFAAMDFVGQALSPLAMVLLGGFIASTKLGAHIRLRHVLPLIGVRLLLVPGAVFLALSAGWLSVAPCAALVLVLEASSPPATNHSLIARRYDGEWELVSSLQLVVHAVALFSVPLWLALALRYVAG